MIKLALINWLIPHHRLPAGFDSSNNSRAGDGGARRHLRGWCRAKRGRDTKTRKPDNKKQSGEAESDEERAPLPARFRLIPPMFQMIFKEFHTTFNKIISPSFSKISFFLSTNFSIGDTFSAPASFKN